MLSVLADRRYRHLFLAQIVALLGTGLPTIALGLFAYQANAPGWCWARFSRSKWWRMSELRPSLGPSPTGGRAARCWSASILSAPPWHYAYHLQPWFDWPTS
ncbi:Major facilitator superfamily protein [Sulfitobacter guttiformis KCTC 32187]|nr:Major facilitator superfamily protein [Sulfitobacter guttiformis KCTC 32187]